ncbi:MAG: hypothetical protein QOF27_80 [Gaiellaceae bacterium]|jgi:hypothetical protein|nr:hypothetical protein [Gaiellaceae bacterium]
MKIKTTTTTGTVWKADASLDVKLNPVELGSKEIVSWAVAFPRSGTPTAHVQPDPAL